MNNYLKKVAQRILRSELNNLDTKLKESQVQFDALYREKEKLQKRVKRMERPENILLAYYRIDNIGSDGMPPSYLRPDNKSDYTQRIGELESVYRNPAFRELMAWSLNFHANMSVVGKLRNGMGDEIEVPSEHAKHMISGIKGIWDLIVAAHLKDRELTASKTIGLDDILSEPVEEGN